MGEFGWAYVKGVELSGSARTVGSVQFLAAENVLSGSQNFVFASGSNNLSLSGSMEVTGTSTFNGFVGAQVFGNSSAINYDIDTGANYNSLLLGPITIANGTSITIGTNSNVKIKDIEDV